MIVHLEYIINELKAQKYFNAYISVNTSVGCSCIQSDCTFLPSAVTVVKTYQP